MSWPGLESPQPLQKAAPVSAGGTEKNSLGSFGLGPSWFVLSGAGGGVLHVCVGPQPKFSSLERDMRLISSLHDGPFYVSQRRPVLGSKVKPKELRMP
jgi:hypothetical protein